MPGHPIISKDFQVSRPSHANAQEPGLRQYTTAKLAQRQRLDDERRRLSPEPHFEMMRPVSPFKNNRQLPKNQEDQQSQVTHPSAYRPVNANKISASEHRGPTSSAHAYRRPTRVQEASASGTNASTNGSASLPKHGAAQSQYKGRPRDARRNIIPDSHSASAPAKPASQAMSSLPSSTPASSDTGHSSGRSGGAQTQSHSHSHGHDGSNDSVPSFKRERGYMSSPESVTSSGRKKNPGWRKPPPKYVPTPPSTPPTVVANALGTVNEDLAPPIPSIASVQKEANLAPATKKVQVQEPPPRPARATSVPPATQFFIPSRPSKAPAKPDRRPTRDAPASTKLKISAPLETLSTAKQPQPPPPTSLPQINPETPNQTARKLNATTSSKSQTLPQPPARPVARSNSPLPPSPPQVPQQSTARSASVDEKKQPVAHAQPKKVPSFAQLVESVRPSRTPSPRVPPKDADTKLDMRAQPRAPSPANTVPVISVTSAVPVQRDFLRPPPDQVLLPPSAKSSRSPSPQPPLRAPSPNPVRTRSRSPVPTVIPQYAPPPPPFPSPPPNTPLAQPKPRFSVLFQANFAASLVGKIADDEEKTEESMSIKNDFGAQKDDEIANKRPVVSTVPAAQRHSGLVTPPTTPPSRTGGKDSGLELPSVESEVPIARSRSPMRGPTPPVANASVAALQIQSQTSMKKAPVIQPSPPERRSSPSPRPVSPQNGSRNAEIVTPPLPANWKETITRVTNSPEPRLPDAVQPVGNSQPESLLSTPNAAPGRDTIRKHDRRGAIISEVIEVEHAPKISAPEPVKDEKNLEPICNGSNSNALHIDVPQPQLAIPDVLPRRSRSPRPLPVIPPSKAHTVPETRTTPHHGAYESVPSHFLAPVSQAELPVRARSPVPRKKVPEEREVNVVREEQQRPPSPSVYDPETSDGFVPVEAEPEAVEQAPPSGANLRRSGKANKGRRATESHDQGQPDTRNALPKTHTFQSHQAIPDKGVARTMSPPPRVPSRNEARTQEAKGKSSTGHRATWDGHGQSFLQSPEVPSPPVVRPSSPPAQSATHQQQPYKHIPHEVHQPFRPPTPPITSHYRKKHSYDQLPAEPFASFMKQPVHVIYPDNSSHAHTMSEDSTLKGTGTVKSSETMREPTDTTAHDSFRKEPRYTGRTQSPDTMEYLLHHKDDLIDIPDEEPTVPPKSRSQTPISPDLSPSTDRLPEFVIQQATKVPYRYPSAPIELSKAHTLTLPPTSNVSERRRPTYDASERSQYEDSQRARSRRLERNRAGAANPSRTARSQSEKVVHHGGRQMSRSRSAPLPSGSHGRSKRGFWQTVGLWAKVVVSKLRTWSTPSSPSGSLHNRYHHDYDY